MNEYLSDVDINDIFSELKVPQFTLSTKTMFAMDNLKFVKLAYCYQIREISYRILLKFLIEIS